MSKNQYLIGLLAASFALTTLLVAGTADAGKHPTVSFGGEYINDFGSSCTVEGGLEHLYYSDDTVEYFATRMKKYGNRKAFLYGNSSAETTDVSAYDDVRNGIRGQDYRYADNVDVYAIDTHGGRSHRDNHFELAMCTSTSWSHDSRTKWEDSNSHKIKWGEQSGGMRWALLFACHSAEQPHLEWMDSFGPYFEVLMGFNGLTYSGPTTDENLGDWVDEVYGDERYFKGAWFYANEDWYYSSIDAVLMAVGDSLNDAIYRRDYQWISSSRRNGGQVPQAFAWSNKVRKQRERRYQFSR